MKSILKILLVIFLFVGSCLNISCSQNKSSELKQSGKQTQSIIDSTKTTITEGINTTDKNINSDSTSISKSLNPNSILEVISFSKIFWSLVLILIGFFLIKIISRPLDYFAEKSSRYRLTIKGLVPIVRIFGWIIIIYFLIAGIFKPPVATLIAVTASVGIAIGFGAQDLLKNILGGILILFDRPYQVGDKILLDDYYGEVIKIGLRSTKIVTPDDSTITIPNGEVMSKSVSNTNYGEPNCQVVAEIYLPVNIDTNVVRQIAIEAAQVSPYIYLNKPIVVLFSNEIKMMKSFLKMKLKAYVMDLRYEFIFKSDMTEKVLNELFSKKIISKEDLD